MKNVKGGYRSSCDPTNYIVACCTGCVWTYDQIVGGWHNVCQTDCQCYPSVPAGCSLLVLS